MASSLNQRLICEPLSSRPIYEAIEPVKVWRFTLPSFKPESELVNIAMKMLGAGVMINANADRASSRPKHSRCCSLSRIPADVFASAVVDGLMD